jgi:signal transduction histidine kinase
MTDRNPPESDRRASSLASLGQDQVEALLTAQGQVLKALSADLSLADMLDAFARTIERQSGDMLCSILLLDGDKLRYGAAPNLPDEYNQAIDGVVIGPEVGSCGTAAFTGQQVIVSDIETDLLWANYRDLALKHGLHACWSTPIITQGRTLGTFALYYRTPQQPNEQDLYLIDTWAQLVALGISRKKAEESLTAEQKHLVHLLQAQEYERKLVALEIHDGLVQYATGATLHLQSYLSSIPDDAIPPQLELVSGLLQKTIEEGRRLMNDLRPPVLDEQGVVAAIKHLIEERRSMGLMVTFEHETMFSRLAPELEVAIFRIVQESLTNAAKHSGSSKVEVVLNHNNNHIHLDIQDWGKGFDPSRVPDDRQGLRGIRKRASLLDGRATIDSKPGTGSRISVVLPLLVPPTNG